MHIFLGLVTSDAVLYWAIHCNHVTDEASTNAAASLEIASVAARSLAVCEFVHPDGETLWMKRINPI
jgi:hypothetical protein